MARFRATVRSSRGEASRLGTEKGGISAYVNGWDLGVNVQGGVNPQGKDFFDIYITGGSNQSKPSQYIGTVFESGFSAVSPKPLTSVDPAGKA